MVALLAFLVILLVLVLMHEAGHALAAWASGCRVEEFGFGFPPRLFGKRVGETLVSVNALPIGGFVRIAGESDEKNDDPRSFVRKSRAVRALILAAGVLANLLLAVVVFSVVLVLGVDLPVEGEARAVENRRVEVLEVRPTPILTAAGLLAHDVLVAVDGTTVRDAQDAARRIRGFEGSELSLTVRRGKDRHPLLLRFSAPKAKGEIVGIGLLDVGTFRVPWYRAPAEGIRMTGRTIRATGTGLAELVRSAVFERRAPSDIAGPVGIASLTGVVAKRGFGSLLEFTGILSVNLAVINALPIPALDGGRLFFLLLDALGIRRFRGRPERLAHTIGFVLLVMLLALITLNDVRKLSP